MKPTKETRIAGLLLTLFLAVFIFTFLSFRSNTKLKNSNSLVSYDNKVLYKSEKLMPLLWKNRNSIINYIKKGDTAALQIFTQTKDSIFNNIAELKRLTANDRRHQLRIDTLLSFVNKKMVIYEQSQQLEMGRHYKKDSTDALLAADGDIMVNLRDIITSMQNEEDSLLIIREKVKHSTEHESGISFIALFGSILFLIITTLFAVKYFKDKHEEQIRVNKKLGSKLSFFSDRMEEIVRSVSDPLFALDQNLNIIFYNNAMKNSIATGKSKLYGKNIFEVFPQYRRNIMGEKINEVIYGGEICTFEAYEEFLDQWQNITIYPTTEGVSIYIKDISERKANEKKINTLKTLLDETNKVAFIGCWDLDISKGTVSWTAVTHLIHETGPDYHPTLKTAISFYKEGKDREMITQAIDNAIITRSKLDIELKIITAKGNERWVYIKGTPEFEGDECVRILGLIQDITVQKRINTLLLQNNEEEALAIFETLQYH